MIKKLIRISQYFRKDFSSCMHYNKGRQEDFNMKKIMIETEKLCKTFSSGGQQQHVLKNLDLKIYEGEFTVIMGASGSGKSTLLYALSGMDQPSLGQVRYGDSVISTMSVSETAVFRRKNCGFVFQQIHLLENMNVMDNILAAGLLVSGNKKAVTARAKELLAAAGISAADYEKFPAQLSGGEAQRVGIVRALINEPPIVFADEPTGALNSAYGTQVLDTLSEVNRRGQTMVVVTHDIRTARRAERILYLKDGMVYGECHLGLYESGNKERHRKLREFLSEMGW